MLESEAGNSGSSNKRRSLKQRFLSVKKSKLNEGMFGAEGVNGLILNIKINKNDMKFINTFRLYFPLIILSRIILPIPLKLLSLPPRLKIILPAIAPIICPVVGLIPKK